MKLTVLIMAGFLAMSTNAAPDGFMDGANSLKNVAGLGSGPGFAPGFGKPGSVPPGIVPGFGKPGSGPLGFGKPGAGPPGSAPGFGKPASGPPEVGKPGSGPPGSAPGFETPTSGPPESAPGFEKPGLGPPGSTPGLVPPGSGPDFGPDSNTWTGTNGIPFPFNVILLALGKDTTKGFDLGAVCNSIQGLDLMKYGEIFSAKDFQDMPKKFSKEEILKTTTAMAQELLASTTDILKKFNEEGGFEKWRNQFSKIFESMNHEKDIMQKPF